MSGVSDKDILLAPIDLTQWDSGQVVPKAEQRLILGDLREWLTKKNTRTDIARPTDEVDLNSNCTWDGCEERPLRRSAYCADHYDDTLLKI